MKIKFLLLLAFTALLTSCNFTENITIKEDGSGVMSMEVDASQLMALAGKELSKESNKRIDSTLSFATMLAEHKDSIAMLPEEQRKAIQSLEKMDMHMLMDPETQEMKISMLTKFTSANELGDMMKDFSKLRSLKKGAGDEQEAGAPKMSFENPASETSYAYDEKKFTKKVKVNNKEAMLKEDELEMYKAMFSESTYTINYTFPKKVKSVSDKNAAVSTDRKTVTLSYSLMDYLENPEKMNIEVKFDK